MSSILNDVKHVLGLGPENTAFDVDIIMHINSVFGTLNQLNVGPDSGYAIESAANEWTEFTSDVRLNPVKSYMFLKVKLMFDPPDRGFMIDSMDRQIQELEYRLNLVGDYSDDSGSGGSEGYVYDLSGGADFPDEAPDGAMGVDLESGDVWRNSDG